MKTILLFFCFTVVLFAQDIIVLVEDGLEIDTEIITISDSIVHYCSFGQNDTLSIPIAEIESITYENGKTDSYKEIKAPVINAPTPKKLSIKKTVFTFNIAENGTTLNSDEIRNRYAVSPRALELYNRGREQNVLGNVIGIPSAAITGWFLADLISGNKDAGMPLILGTIGTATGIIISEKSKKNIIKSVTRYNTDIRQNSLKSILIPNNVILYANGGGLVWCF